MTDNSPPSTPVRTRTRSSDKTTDAPVAPLFMSWDETRAMNGRLLGWAHKMSDGSYQVFRATPSFLGATKTYAEAHSLLTKDV